MDKLLEGLKDYFNNTPQEVLERDWKEIKPYNKIGFNINRDYINFVKSKVKKLENTKYLK